MSLAEILTGSGGALREYACFRHDGHDTVRDRYESLSLFGQLRRDAVVINQHLLAPPFEVLDVLRDCTLGDPQFLGGHRPIFRPRDDYKGL